MTSEEILNLPMSGRGDTKKQLQMLSDSELMSLQAEIGREMKNLGKRIGSKRSTLQLIKNELGRRSSERRSTGGFLVSDHAIVRYLERCKDMDIEAIRQEIFALAKKGKRVDGTDRFKNGGAVFAINQDHLSISTIMSLEEEELVSGCEN